VDRRGLPVLLSLLLSVAVPQPVPPGKITLLNVRELQEFDRRCMDVACGNLWGGRTCALPTSSVCGYPVVADQMSVLPKVAGQSRSGQGAGSTRSPAASEAAR
jgi:hypothetical protein